MDDTQKQGEAHYLLQHPLLNEILDGIERQAVETAVFARPSDDETRRTTMETVRVVRSLREQLAEIAEPTKPTRKASIA